MRMLNDEDRKNYLDWSEGNKYLYELLCACGENEISTFASCGGHEDEHSNPYLGIIINNNSMPLIKKMLEQVQDIPNISVSTMIRGVDNSQLLEDHEAKSIVFRASNFNCCELFYKMKRGIETKDRATTLKPEALRFYKAIERLHNTTIEDLKKYLEENVSVGMGYSTKTPEFLEYESSKYLVKNSKFVRFIKRLLPFRKSNNGRFEELRKKYCFLQKNYYDDNNTEIYVIDNSNNEIEKAAIMQMQQNEANDVQNTVEKSVTGRNV